MVTMSLGQYARVSPSARNITPHHPYSRARRHIIQTHTHTLTHTPAALSVSGVDASICELASVFSIFHRPLSSQADCVAVSSRYNQSLYNEFK